MSEAGPPPGPSEPGPNDPGGGQFPRYDYGYQGYQQGGYGQPGYGQPYGGWQGQPPPYAHYGGPVPESNSKATAALVLGIAGLVVCPLICSVIGLVLGYQARSEIDASGGMQTGRGNAIAGIVLGWIGVGLSALGIAFLIVVAIVAEDATYDDEPRDFHPGAALALAAARALRLALA